jgi:hypothetical protein
VALVAASAPLVNAAKKDDASARPTDAPAITNAPTPCAITLTAALVETAATTTKSANKAAASHAAP